MRTIAVLVVMLVTGALMLAISAGIPVSSHESEERETEESQHAAAGIVGEEGKHTAEGSGEEGEAESTLAGLTGIGRDIGIIVLVTLAVSWFKRVRIQSSHGFTSSSTG